jgi:hypothetical protein
MCTSSLQGRIQFGTANLHVDVLIEMAMLFKGKAIPPASSALDDQGRQMVKRLGLYSTPEIAAPAINKAVRAKSIYMLAEHVFPSAHPIMLITNGKFIDGAALIVPHNKITPPRERT